jgi:hypothetical protein
MNIVSVTSPVYASADNSQINCEVTFDDGNTYPYTSNAADKMPYGIQLWADLNAGKYGTIAPYST